MKQAYRSTGRLFFALSAVAMLFAGCDDEPAMAPADTPSPAFAGGAAQEKMVFASELNGTQDIYLSNGSAAAGDALKNLTPWPGTSIQADPALSPDGRYVAFTSDLHSGFDLFVVTTDGLSAWQVGVGLAGSQFRPVWSPDSKRIAFASEHTGNTEIFVIDLGGTGLTQLTNDPGVDIPGSWSRAGIYFESTRAGDREIYRMNADGAGVVRITTSPGEDARPRISPKGKHILFESTRDGNLELYLMNVDGTNQVRLTNRPTKEYMGAWSPNGRQIVYVSDYLPGSGEDLYTMNADGSGQAATSGFFGNESSPSWGR